MCVCEGIRYMLAGGWRMVVMVVRDDGDDLDGMLVVACGYGGVVIITVFLFVVIVVFLLSTLQSFSLSSEGQNCNCGYPFNP